MAQFNEIVTINGEEYDLKGNVDFSNITITKSGDDNIPDPEPQPGTKPTEGTVKKGGWGANLDKKDEWKVVAMKDNPALWKIVDAAGKNVATEFSKKEIAESFITYFKTHPFPPEDTNVPPPVTPDQPPVGTGDGPYPQKVGSKTLQSEQRGPTTRHYASGKPDDETIEKNVKDIPYRNYQWIVETTIKEMEHDDTISLKFGGQHTTGNGWWDCGVGIYDGQTCLGSEPKHPSTNLCVVKGPKIGDIRNKKIKIAGVFFEENDHIELWTNLGDGGWKKQVEGDHIDNLKPDHSKGHETQERIDGYKKGSVPELHFAVVQEIEPKSGTVPTPPPVTPPTPTEPSVVTPPVTGSGTDKYGTKLLVADGSTIEYTYRNNFRDDGKRFDFKIPNADKGTEAQGYFKFTADPVDDEVSIKWSEVSHSGHNDVQCYDSGVSIKDGKTRMRFENPHPEYSGNLGGGQGVPLNDKFIGYKGIWTPNPDGSVTVKLYQDAGNNEGDKPANEWKEVYNYTDTKYKRSGPHPEVTIRVDDPAKQGQKNLEAKWLSIAKI
jgi:hypothetical protein